MHIHLKTSTVNGAHWGEDLKDQQAEVLARNTLALCMAWTKKKWPQAEVEGTLTHEYVTSPVYGTPPDIVEEVAFYVFGQTSNPELYASDFDAYDYLSAHPD